MYQCVGVQVCVGLRCVSEVRYMKVLVRISGTLDVRMLTYYCGEGVGLRSWCVEAWVAVRPCSGRGPVGVWVRMV